MRYSLFAECQKQKNLLSVADKSNEKQVSPKKVLLRPEGLVIESVDASGNG